MKGLHLEFWLFSGGRALLLLDTTAVTTHVPFSLFTPLSLWL